MIQVLSRNEWRRQKSIRLRALLDAPEAFGTTYGQSIEWPDRKWMDQLDELHSLVWVEDGEDLGMVRGVQSSDDPDVAYLLSMWVDPVARGRGIGAALVNDLLAWAGSLGYTKVLLDVGRENPRAQALYRSCGFAPTGRTWNLPPPRERIVEIEMARAIATD